MAQVTTMPQAAFDEILYRLRRLETMVAKLLTQKNAGIPMVDKETEKDIAKGLEDIKKGRYTAITTEKELDAYLNSL